MAKVESSTCSQCGAPLDIMETTCKFCGISIEPAQNFQGNMQQGKYMTVQINQPYSPQFVAPTYKTTKNKTAAGVLAIFLGALGVHKFYLGKPLQGIIYLLFCWTYIPGILGVIDGIILLTSSEEKFNQKYGKLEA
ncbi:TM2 domain-containing protein [Fusibacter sp. 3D3]|uniref:TM2 domain-containing protein n=1 Tax=Fusibacter sp. 3D3 TaxID=1048380 RepID=UPI0008534996|nr:TM2 domain-containing protein [Fusibacter sp. 3D3]GAU76257.1 predicted membrane protein [Fusibacter sp. 3D3]